MLKKVKAMLGFAPKVDRPVTDRLTAQVIVATQRNERAAEKVRALLQDLASDENHMAGTVKSIVGKMK
jgi:hypothetical protein